MKYVPKHLLPLLAVTIIMAFSAIEAQSAPAVAAKSRAQFCNAIKDPLHFQKLIAEDTNRLAFTNSAYGFASGGVCWWHNRIQRAALYLTVYRPDKPKPSRASALQIIESLKSMNHVIEIPGYANLYEFSADYAREMIQSLENWQVSDGVFGGGWINGLSRTPFTAEKNWRTLIALKERTDRGRIPLMIVNDPRSVVSHSALVTAVEPIEAYRASVRFLDPNYSFIARVQVSSDQNHIYLYPITVISYESDFEKFSAAQECYCQKKCATTASAPFDPFRN